MIQSIFNKDSIMNIMIRSGHIIMLLVLVACSENQFGNDMISEPKLIQYDFEEVTTPNDTLTYLKRDMSLITGIVKSFDNEPIYEAHYSEGQLHGQKTTWYSNRKNQIKTQEFYQNGKRHGLQHMWYEDGQLMKQGNYLFGHPNSVQRNWYENGQLCTKHGYHDGIKEGLHQEWYRDGNMRNNLFYEKNELYPNHRLFENLSDALRDTNNSRFDTSYYFIKGNNGVLHFWTEEIGYEYRFVSGLCCQTIVTPFSEETSEKISEILNNYFNKIGDSRWDFYRNGHRAYVNSKEIPIVGYKGFSFELDIAVKNDSKTKLIQLFEGYIDNELISETTSISQFLNASESEIEALYIKGIEEGYLSTRTDFGTFITAW